MSETKTKNVKIDKIMKKQILGAIVIPVLTIAFKQPLVSQTYHKTPKSGKVK
jgi:hypothetical protein